ALDDRPAWFAPYCEHLIACDGRRGFDDEVAARLRAALTRTQARLARARWMRSSEHRVDYGLISSLGSQPGLVPSPE
ncbi:MAG: hypothetical protein NZL99_07090, partial [Burkholderiaceae bacterium]|nr:hypothetical protein [Burkholderiaceae bacterium]